MATSPSKLQQGYGIGNALQPIPPFTIVANRAPTAADKAKFGTLWDYKTGVAATDEVYMLTSVTGGASNWTRLSNNGGAGVFTSLTVNGASTFAGNITQTAGVTSLLQTTINGSLTQNNGATLLNTDNIAQTIQIGTGLAAKNIQIGNQADVTVRALGGKFKILDNAVSTTPSLFIESSAAAGADSCLDTFQLLDGKADIRSLRFTPSPVAAAHQFFKANANPATGGLANVANNDCLGQFDFFGFRQTGAGADAFSEGAQIQSLVTDVDAVAGTISSNLRFITRTPGAVLTVKATVTETGELQINTAGKTLAVTGGAGGFIGNGTLGAGGTVNVAIGGITVSDKVFITVLVPNNPGFLSVTVNAGVGFTVTSSNAADTSTFDYFIVRQI